MTVFLKWYLQKYSEKLFGFRKTTRYDCLSRKEGNIMKRFIALVLILSLILLSCPSALAVSSSLPQEDTTIKQTEDGYVMVVGEGDSAEEYPVGRIDISFSDPESVAVALNHSGVSQEIKDHISEKYAFALQTGNTNIKMVLYSQELLPKSRGFLPSVYNIYNGVQMRTDILEQTLVTRTVEVASGRDMSSELGLVFDLTVTSIGMISEQAVALFAGGVSLLTTLIRAGLASYTTGSDGSFAETSIGYDLVTQWTYCNIGDDWQLGLITQAGVITKVNTRIALYDSLAQSFVYDETFQFVLSDEDIETGAHSVESPHYQAPWSYAYQNMNNPIEEYLRAEINGVTFYL